MSRLSAVALVGLGAYGVAMAATGVSLAASAVSTVDAQTPVTLVDTPPSSVPAQLGTRTLLPEPAISPGAPGLSAGPSISVNPSKVPSARSETPGASQQASFVPAELVLPNGRSAPVRRADVTGDGALLIPDDPQVVAYWSGGAKPGEPYGSTVIAGHLDSARYGIGILAGLKGVQAGEVIEIRNGKQHQRYRVTKTQTVPQASLATDNQTLFDQSVPYRLVVITCGGPFDPVKHHYQDNFVVVATPTP